MSRIGEQLGYTFAGFRLDAQHRVVSRGNGEALPLAPKAFDTLLYLVERPGQLIGKKELLEAIWPNVVVEENNLNQSISALRRVLGEHPGEHRFIVTEPGRGYRFVASVERLSSSPQERYPTIGPDRSERESVRRTPTNTRRPALYAGVALLVAVALLAATYRRSDSDATAPLVSNALPFQPRSITFRVAAPQGSRFEFASAMPAPALSPDGWQLAYVAPLEVADDVLGRRDTESVLWIQTLGEDSARPLHGTTGAQAPFWSPDGADVGFFTVDRRLRRIAATGNGAPRDLASNVFGGAAWNADGTIVLGGTTGLLRMSADGGEAAPVTRVDDTRGEYSHRFPMMLPDAQHFLYLILSTQPEHEGLFLGSLADRELKKLIVHTNANGALGRDPDGRDHLFFVRDFALLAQPFDTERGELYESPVVVARSIEPAQTVRRAAFAVSGRNLVYRPRVRPATRLRWVDRRGIPLGSVGADGQRYSYPSLSPDGTKLAVAHLDRQTDKEDIWWFDLRRHDSGERLTADPVEAVHPVWMPDGSGVLFSSARDGAWNIYRRQIGGSGNEEPLVVAPSPVIKTVRDVTRDGRFVLYEGTRDLWLAPLVGDAQPRALMPKRLKVDARVSPNGRWVAYTSDNAAALEVYVASFPELKDPKRISTAGGSDPQWRADGRELYYIAPGPMLMAVRIGADATSEVGNPEPLFRISPDRRSLRFGSVYAPALDGQRFLVVERIEIDDVQLVATLNWTVQP